MQRPVTQKILMQIYGIQAFVDIEPDLISQGTDKAFSPVISCSKACIYFLQVFATLLLPVIPIISVLRTIHKDAYGKPECLHSARLHN